MFYHFRNSFPPYFLLHKCLLADWLYFPSSHSLVVMGKLENDKPCVYYQLRPFFVCLFVCSVLTTVNLYKFPSTHSRVVIGKNRVMEIYFPLMVSQTLYSLLFLLYPFLVSYNSPSLPLSYFLGVIGKWVTWYSSSLLYSEPIPSLLFPLNLFILSYRPLLPISVV